MQRVFQSKIKCFTIWQSFRNTHGKALGRNLLGRWIIKLAKPNLDNLKMSWALISQPQPIILLHNRFKLGRTAFRTSVSTFVAKFRWETGGLKENKNFFARSRQKSLKTTEFIYSSSLIWNLLELRQNLRKMLNEEEKGKLFRLQWTSTERCWIQASTRRCN